MTGELSIFLIESLAARCGHPVQDIFDHVVPEGSRRRGKSESSSTDLNAPSASLSYILHHRLSLAGDESAASFRRMFRKSRATPNDESEARGEFQLDSLNLVIDIPEKGAHEYAQAYVHIDDSSITGTPTKNGQKEGRKVSCRGSDFPSNLGPKMISALHVSTPVD
jgi:hypothetical protein